MVELTIEGDLAVFRVVSWYRRWAIASLREVRVPLAHIHGARHERPPSPLMKGWTNLGCWIPGVITFGSYQVHGERHFYDVMDWSKVVVVNVQNERYSRLAVQVEDPPAAVRLLNGNTVIG